ncbi:MAG: sugar phosphate isomerase/epimerase, partial [Verrucomicrobiaceae bacterium]
MNLAISNIAWTSEEDAAAYELLSNFGVRALEIAPARLFQNPALASEEEVEKALEPIRAAGLSIVAFQAILFGKPELTVFETKDVRLALIDYLGGLAKTAAACGARPLVFGAPKNRCVPAG